MIGDRITPPENRILEEIKNEGLTTYLTIQTKEMVRFQSPPFGSLLVEGDVMKCLDISI